MSKYTEHRIAIEAVKVVEEYGQVAMSELIKILTDRMMPSGHDAEIIENRNDTYFSQKVRNLRSHGNKIFFENVVYDEKTKKYTSKEFVKLQINVDDETFKKKVEEKQKKTIQFYARKIDFDRVNAEKKLIGNGGEELVLLDQYNKVNIFAPEIVKEIRHVSKLDGDGAGYDISSFDSNKRILYIEVKSTTKSKETPFYMSLSEYSFYELHKENYVIARVYDYNVESKTGKIQYTLGNDFESMFEKEVSAYKIIYKS